jgi:hypothetical protein
MTYHLPTRSRGLGEVGTYKQYGTGIAEFRVSGLSGTSAESTKALAKILAMVKAIPGVLSADAAWIAGGIIKTTFRMAEGSPVEGTANAIKRVAPSVGPQISANAKVTVTSTRHTTADINRTAPAATPADVSIAPTPGPVTPEEVAPTAPAPSSMPIWPFAVGAGVLVLGLGAFFMLRKKPAKLTVGAA